MTIEKRVSQILNGKNVETSKKI